MKLLKLMLIATLMIFSSLATADNLYQNAVNNPARPAEDVKKDKLRDPAIALKFAGVKPGMQVFDFFTGGGYYAFLMSLVVGPEGHVIAHNPTKFYEIFKSVRAVVDKRKQNKLFSNVSWVDAQPDQLSAVPSNSQDLIMSHLVFHDAFWIGGEPGKTVAEFYRILKPGGSAVIIDHAAVIGTKDKSANNREGIHRVDENFVIEMFENAGFKLEAKSDAFRNPADDRTQPFFSKELRGKKTDRFMIKMKKPVHK